MIRALAALAMVGIFAFTPAQAPAKQPLPKGQSLESLRAVPKSGPGDEYPDTPTGAPALAPNSQTAAVFNDAADFDVVRFDFPSAGTWTISTTGSRDTVGVVYAANGQDVVGSNDDNNGDLNFRIVVHVTQAASYFVSIAEFTGATGPYTIVSTFAAGVAPTDDYANAPSGAAVLDVNGSRSGALTYANDQDWFRVQITQPGTWWVSSTGDTDTIGEVYLANGTTIVAESDDAEGFNFGLRFRVDSPGTYYVRVTGFRGDSGSYTVTSAFAAGALPPSFTDLWWNPAESGWGINLNHQGDILFATLFTYDATGRDYWLVASDLRLQSDGSYFGNLLQTQGPAFSTSPWTSVQVTDVGFMSVRFPTLDSAELSYVVNGVFVQKTIQRQRFSTAATCQIVGTSRDGASNYQDLWWNPAESGWGINLTHQGNIIFATLFTYDVDGRNMWLVASNLQRQPDGSFTGDLFRTRGPAFNAEPWPGGIQLNTVGTMTLRFTSGTSGTLSYRVGTTNVSRTITRQVFSSPTTFCN